MSSAPWGMTGAESIPPPDERAAVAPFTSAADHLLAEIECLKHVLHLQVLRLRAGGLLVENDFRGLYISDEQVDAILHGRDPAHPDAATLALRIRREQDVIAARARMSAEAGISLPLVRLCRIFGLTAFERQVMVASVAPELDLRFEALFSYVQNDVNRKRPIIDLMLKIFAETPAVRLELLTAFSPEGTLLRNTLIECIDDPQNRAHSTLARALRTDQHITAWLLDHSGIDARLRSFASIASPSRTLQELMLPPAVIEDLGNAIPSFGGQGAVLLFCGPDGAGKRSAAEALSAAQQRPLLTADLRQALLSPLSLPEILALLSRDAALHGANLFLANAHVAPEKGQISQHLAALEKGLAPAGRLVFLGSEFPAAEFKIQTGFPSLVFNFPVPCFEYRVRFWQAAIHDTALPSPGVDAAALANKFALTGGAIHAACRSAGVAALLRSPAHPSVCASDLESAARAQSSQGLRRLAQKIEGTQTWSDLVLPPRAFQQLRAVSAAHKYRHVVYSQWGFDHRLAMGKGLNVLFWGPSGTGKTMAAGVLAQELALDMYKIDLSSVVSKYIGETEKQLSQLFREAQASNAILFFDEADALFGKRSEVKDAHDRYANVETAYLLQKMEEYEGIVILTTNFRKNMDDAFARRMHHVVEFSFPDASQRLRIWMGLIPPGAALAEDVDFGFLARQFELAGGNIRNIVLAAAFLAAEQGKAICMEHLILATASELQKVGKLPSKSDFREYLDLIHAQV